MNELLPQVFFDGHSLPLPQAMPPQICARLKNMRQDAQMRHIPVLHAQTEQLLAALVLRHAPKNILEIGTAVGYSAILLLQNSPRGAMLNTIEIDRSRQIEARKNLTECGLISQANLFLGDASEIIFKLSGKYDFIYLDGPKGQYAAFLPFLLPLLADGGALVADNVGYFGLTSQADALPKRHKHITIAKNLKAFLNALFAQKCLTTKIFDVGDGVSYSVKNEP